MREIRRWWLALWLVVALALVALGIFLPFFVVAALLQLAFLVLESIAVYRRDPRMPGVITILARLIPKGIAYPVIYGFFGAFLAAYFGQPNPWVTGFVVGFTERFNMTVTGVFEYVQPERPEVDGVEEEAPDDE